MLAVDLVEFDRLIRKLRMFVPDGEGLALLERLADLPDVDMELIMARAKIRELEATH